MTTTEFSLTNREILPINQGKFGVVVTESEAAELQKNGYHAVTLPVPSRRKEGDTLQHHLEVYITAKDRHENTFDIALLETAGYANEIVIMGFPWTVGERSGIKAYVIRVDIHLNHICKIEKGEDHQHDGDHECACGTTWPVCAVPAEPGQTIDRYDIAWRIWCYTQGYALPESRDVLNNWMRDPDDGLTPHDIRSRDSLLAIADDVIEVARGSHGPVD